MQFVKDNGRRPFRQAHFRAVTCEEIARALLYFFFKAKKAIDSPIFFYDTV